MKTILFSSFNNSFSKTSNHQKIPNFQQSIAIISDQSAVRFEYAWHNKTVQKLLLINKNVFVLPNAVDPNEKQFKNNTEESEKYICCGLNVKLDLASQLFLHDPLLGGTFYSVFNWIMVTRISGTFIFITYQSTVNV